MGSHMFTDVCHVGSSCVCAIATAVLNLKWSCKHKLNYKNGAMVDVFVEQ